MAITIVYDGADYMVLYGVSSARCGFQSEEPFTTPIPPGTPYTVQIFYDNNKTVTFFVIAESHSVTGQTRAGVSTTKFKGLTTGVWVSRFTNLLH